MARGVEVLANHGRLIRAVRRHAYDVVHVEWIPFEEGRLGLMPRLRAACENARCLLVFTAHNATPHDAKSPDLHAIARSINHAHVVIAHTEHVAQELREKVQVKVPIEIVPHGPLFADLELPCREEASKRLGRVQGPTVLFQGIARPYKGLDLLGEAWPAVRRAFPEAELIVVGRALDDVARSHQLAIAELPGTTVVQEYLSVERMLDYYAVSDIVVFPYRAISQSGALMTAAGLGLPTVVTPITGFVEQTQELTSSIVARAVEGDAIAEAIVYSLTRREQLLHAAQKDRQALADSPTGWMQVAKRTREVYEEYRVGARNSS
jgi:glycosyltransferase involved in cell wall biosynthesis